MRLLCRDSHDEVPEDRCPPHEFHAAMWDDIGNSRTLSAMFCSLCGDVRPLEPPAIGPAVEEMAESRSER